MNNTAALIAQFKTTVPIRYVHNDVNADGKSDLFWYSQNLSQMTYWLMNGATKSSWTLLTLPAGYRPVAYGDFNGDGHADILFDTPSNSVYMWLSDGSGGFTNQFVVTHKPGSIIVGTGDVNHDGFSDIFWLVPSSGQATYWLMNGATNLSWRGFAVPADYQFKGSGDFNGDGYADMLWEDSARHDYMWLNDGNGGFTSTLFNTHQPGWILAGVGDADGDGKSDVFWYNQSIGQLTYWLMNGATLTSWKRILDQYGECAGWHRGLRWQWPGGCPLEPAESFAVDVAGQHFRRVQLFPDRQLLDQFRAGELLSRREAACGKSHRRFQLRHDLEQVADQADSRRSRRSALRRPC